jgi:nucleoside 2-deoxyribosyltransferase
MKREMPYTIFVSHSVGNGDRLLIGQLLKQLILYDIACSIAERNLKVGEPLSLKTEDAIRSADCVLAILTKGGTASSHVSRELGFAYKMGKHAIAVFEKDINQSGLAAMGYEFLEVDRNDFIGCASGLTRRLAELEADVDIQTTISWAMSAILSTIFVSRR